MKPGVNATTLGLAALAYVTTLSLGKLRLLGVSELQPSHLHNSTVVGFLENFNEFLTCQVFGIIRGT